MEKVKTRGRLHQLPIKDGSVVTLISHGAVDPNLDNGWALPDLGERVDVYRSKGNGSLYCFGIGQKYWRSVRGEWELLNFDPPLSVEEML